MCVLNINYVISTINYPGDQLYSRSIHRRPINRRPIHRDHGIQSSDPFQNTIDKSYCTFNLNKAYRTSFSLLIQDSVTSVPSNLPLIDSYHTFTKSIDSVAKQCISIKNANPKYFPSSSPC